MLRILLPILLLLAIADPSFAAARPNIILCMADDQGWGDVAYNGHPYLKTPHLDAMSKSGLRFDRFYAAAPVCSPTRASVMTGRHPNRMGVFRWGLPMRPQEITIAEVIKKAGYTTGHFGKWHLGSIQKTSPCNPGVNGFDHWLSAYNFYDNDPILSRNGVAVQMKGESSIVAADAAIAFIKSQQQKNKPFFAVVWFGSPHVPHRSVAEDMKHYESGKKANHWAGEITGLDRAVGKLRAALRDLKIQENTLFWYCSDNGGLKHESAGGRGKKGSIYEGGLRVPGIIEWPARIKQPRVTQAMANTSDIYPTLLNLLDIKVPDQPVLDGVSLVSEIDNTTGDRNRKGMGFWSYPGGGIKTPHAAWSKELLQAQQSGNMVGNPNHLLAEAGKIKRQLQEDTFPGHSAWLAWPWKLHRIQGKNGPVKLELYNLQADGKEEKNIAGQHGDRVKAMQTELDSWLKSVAKSHNGHDYR